MKKKYKFFVVSDIHGEYDALMRTLQEAGYNPDNEEHFFVAVGDSFDRGPRSRDIYRFFRDLPSQRSKFVKGNHDLMFQEYLEKGMDGEFVLFNILHNGLGATINSFGCLDMENLGASISILDDCYSYIQREYPGLKKFIKDMPLWFETDHFVFVHAGLNPELSNWRETDEHYALWDIADAHKRVPSCDKLIVFGHYHTDQVAEQAKREGDNKVYRLNSINSAFASISAGRTNFSVRNYGNEDEFSAIYLPNARKIAIDGCTNLTHKVNVLVFEDTITTPDEEPTPEQPADISTIKISKDDMSGYVTTVEGVRADGVITTTAEWNPGVYTINMANYVNFTEPQWFTAGLAETDVDGGERI